MILALEIPSLSSESVEGQDDLDVALVVVRSHAFHPALRVLEPGAQLRNLQLARVPGEEPKCYTLEFTKFRQNSQGNICYNASILGFHSKILRPPIWLNGDNLRRQVRNFPQKIRAFVLGNEPLLIYPLPFLSSPFRGRSSNLIGQRCDLLSQGSVLGAQGLDLGSLLFGQPGRQLGK